MQPTEQNRWLILSALSRLRQAFMEQQIVLELDKLIGGTWKEICIERTETIDGWFGLAALFVDGQLQLVEPEAPLNEWLTVWCQSWEWEAEQGKEWRLREHMIGTQVKTSEVQGLTYFLLHSPGGKALHGPVRV